MGEKKREIWGGRSCWGGTYKRFIFRTVGADEGGERLLGAEDGAGEIGLVDRFVLERDAEDGVGVWDAVEGYVVFFDR